MHAGWIQELSQQRDDCQLGDRKREDAWAESRDGILDGVLLLFDAQIVKVSLAAGCCCGAGNSQIDKGTNLALISIPYRCRDRLVGGLTMANMIR